MKCAVDFDFLARDPTYHVNMDSYFTSIRLAQTNHNLLVSPNKANIYMEICESEAKIPTIL